MKLMHETGLLADSSSHTVVEGDELMTHGQYVNGHAGEILASCCAVDANQRLQRESAQLYETGQGAWR
jgi:hypothetical protein